MGGGGGGGGGGGDFILSHEVISFNNHTFINPNFNNIIQHFVLVA